MAIAAPAGTPLVTPFTTAYVEVNSNSFKNPNCYTYGSTAKQLFSFAVIFAANINYTNGKPATTPGDCCPMSMRAWPKPN